MKLFHLKEWTLVVSEEAWGLSAFNKLLVRDKTKGKVVANAEMLFIWYWCDVKSDYIGMTEEVRELELKKDIKALPPKWEKDKYIDEAIELYRKFETITEKLYRQSYQSATAIGDYLENTKALLNERDTYGKPVIDISKITTANGKMPKLMADLKAAYKEVIKEQTDNENKKKGSQSFNLFENGFEQGN